VEAGEIRQSPLHYSSSGAQIHNAMAAANSANAVSSPISPVSDSSENTIDNLLSMLATPKLNQTATSASTTVRVSDVASPPASTIYYPSKAQPPSDIIHGKGGRVIRRAASPSSSDNLTVTSFQSNESPQDNSGGAQNSRAAAIAIVSPASALGEAFDNSSESGGVLSNSFDSPPPIHSKVGVHPDSSSTLLQPRLFSSEKSVLQGNKFHSSSSSNAINSTGTTMYPAIGAAHSGGNGSGSNGSSSSFFGASSTNGTASSKPLFTTPGSASLSSSGYASSSSSNAAGAGMTSVTSFSSLPPPVASALGGAKARLVHPLLVFLLFPSYIRFCKRMFYPLYVLLL
jgi:hypothetical protein